MYAMNFSKRGGCEVLEELQTHGDDDVYEKAAEIVGKFFSGDEDDEEMIADQVGSYQVNTNNNLQYPSPFSAA